MALLIGFRSGKFRHSAGQSLFEASALQSFRSGDNSQPEFTGSRGIACRNIFEIRLAALSVRSAAHEQDIGHESGFVTLMQGNGRSESLIYCAAQRRIAGPAPADHLDLHNAVGPAGLFRDPEAGLGEFSVQALLEVPGHALSVADNGAGRCSVGAAVLSGIGIGVNPQRGRRCRFHFLCGFHGGRNAAPVVGGAGNLRESEEHHE